MRFLEVNECAEWARERGGEIGDGFSLMPDPGLVHGRRIVWDVEGGADPSLVKKLCLSVVEPADACLLWVTLTEVWSSSEDWPHYYGLRGQRNERRSIWQAPGHLFDSPDDPDLDAFLDVTLRFGWDAHLLPSRGGRLPNRVQLSHDGWIEWHATDPIPDAWGNPRGSAT